MALHQKQNMREHLQAVQEIVLGLAGDDFAAIERAGARLGSSPQMTQMCTHMGSGAPGFSERALSFHHTADGIGVAARARDRGAVTTALGATLRACTSCHEAFQQRVVEASVFPHGVH
jgi:cytochrome c556